MTRAPSAPLFVLRGAGVRYGAINALEDVTLTIHAGERVALTDAALAAARVNN